MSTNLVMMNCRQTKLARWWKNVINDDSTDDLPKTAVPREVTGFQSSFALEERARVLIQRFEIEAAIPLLEEASETQSQQLMLAECYIEVGKYGDAMTCVENLKQKITSRPRPKVSEITELINVYITTSFDLRALILLRCVSKLHKVESDPNAAVTAIEDCSYKCYCIVDTLVERDKNMRSFVTEFGPKFILGMLRDLRGVKQEEGDRKNECEARCLNNIGLCFRIANNYPKAVTHLKEGVHILKFQKNPRSLTYKVLGDLLKNLGLMQYEQEKFVSAEITYLQSLDAYGVAEEMELERKNRLCRKTQSL